MNDEARIDELLGCSSQLIEDMVSRALQHGQRASDIAILLERKFDGQGVATCEARSTLAERLGAYPAFGAEQRADMAARLGVAPRHIVPVVVILYEGEGTFIVGLRGLQGATVGVG